MKRLFICLGLLAAVAMLCGQAAKPQATTVTCTDPNVSDGTLSFTKAVYSCTSDHSEKLQFERRVDSNTGRVFYDGPATLHQPQEVGLNPGTTYTYSVSEPVGKRWQVVFNGQFRTPLPNPATVGLTPHNVTLDGAAFFPTIADITRWGCQPSNNVIVSSLEKGADVLYGNCGWPFGDGDDSYLRQRLPGIGWWLEFDPEMVGRMTLPELLPVSLEGNARRSSPDILINNDRSLCDCNSHESAIGLFESIRSDWRSGKPVVDSLNLTPISGGRCRTAVRLRLLFYTAACGGARGWMTVGDRALGTPDTLVPPEIMATAWQLSRVELAIWGPVFFAPQVPVSHKAYSALVGCAFRDKGVTTVFAMNTGPKKLVGKLKVRGLGTRRASVWRETRKVRAKKGVIKDRFRKFGVHIYVFA